MMLGWLVLSYIVLYRLAFKWFGPRAEGLCWGIGILHNFQVLVRTVQATNCITMILDMTAIVIIIGLK